MFVPSQFVPLLGQLTVLLVPYIVLMTDPLSSSAPAVSSGVFVWLGSDFLEIFLSWST